MFFMKLVSQLLIHLVYMYTADWKYLPLSKLIYITGLLFYYSIVIYFEVKSSSRISRVKLPWLKLYILSYILFYKILLPHSKLNN